MEAKSRKQKKPSALGEYRSLFPYIARYRWRYLFGLIALIIVDAAQMIIPQFLREAVDLISSGSFEWKSIIVLAILMVVVMGVISGGRYLWRYFIHGSSRRIESELREKIFSHCMNLSWDFYQQNKIGDLMARSTNDLNAVRMAIGMGLVAFVDFVVMTTAILIIIFVQDARSALYTIMPLPLVTVLILVFGKAVGKRFQRAQETYSNMSDTVQETFAGIRVVKSFVKEWWFIKKFADTNDDYRAANMDLVRLFGFFFPFVTFLSAFTILIMLVVGGIRVVEGLMTPGSLVAMFRYLQMLIWPLMGAGFVVNMIQRGAVSLKRVNEILNTIPSIRDKEIASLKTSRKDAKAQREEGLDSDSKTVLEIKGLNFAYIPDKPVLSDINFSLKEGEWLGIMGRTGSGKSTLVRTFMRMLDPPPNTVFVNGRDVHDWQLENLRGVFAVSPQDSYLFSDSIKNNIGYGLETTQGDSPDVLQKAADIASLERDMAALKQGWETVIGERGLTLSGGQKQRTAIARALALNSEFLVLDDSLSAVDTETEQKILEGILSERKASAKRRTTIIISHRVSSLRYADRVLVLDEGCVAGYGTPAELAAAGGYYARMAALQQLDRDPVGEVRYG